MRAVIWMRHGELTKKLAERTALRSRRRRSFRRVLKRRTVPVPTANHPRIRRRRHTTLVFSARGRGTGSVSITSSFPILLRRCRHAVGAEPSTPPPGAEANRQVAGLRPDLPMRAIGEYADCYGRTAGASYGLTKRSTAELADAERHLRRMRAPRSCLS